MKTYVVYFANNNEYSNREKFEFEYSVQASSEKEAKENAIAAFHEENPNLELCDYTYGFVKN